MKNDGHKKLAAPALNRPNHWLKKFKNGMFDFLCIVCYNRITEGASEIKSKETIYESW